MYACCTTNFPLTTLQVNHYPQRSLGWQVVDFQWHATDPYTMASVSDSGEGSTLQAWRISDMIWRPIDVVLAELEQHRWPVTLQPWLLAVLCAYCVCDLSTMRQHSEYSHHPLQDMAYVTRDIGHRIRCVSSVAIDAQERCNCC